MKSSVLSRLRGSVRIVVRGGNLERLINELAKEGIEIWDVRSLPERKMEMNVQLSDYFSLRPLLKRTGCRMSVKRRSGMPFLLARLWRRKIFIAGFALFIAIIFALSSLVWDIEVQGNENISTEDVLRAAREEGIYPFQWIFRLQKQDKLSAELTRKLAGSSWVGVSRSGTRITIQVVEATRPKEQELRSPSHLVSSSDAVITQIYSERGQPQVKKHDRVRKGQVLIAGIQGNEFVVAKGEIKGIVWHEYNIEVPLVRKQNVYTGEKKERGYLFFGKTAVQITGYGRPGFAEFQTLSELDPLTWRSWKLPFGWMSEKLLETTVIQLKLSAEQAKQDGIDRALRDIYAKQGVESKIVSQKILHEKTDNGKVYMKVLFEVEQNIAEDLPIVYDQGE
ncbi:sporulation protein YqfD [Paenibacillus woosongensis]|uniref:Sporulation protein YqfD n=1 Tax=Paenibacillus woosongensis TaxID=307580 RepID=A0A7X3CMQ4_9BACL|nr:sporulation protein YqfD [Paenibacillus woosongensis]MUG45059.1 sporulation protein YqfD [Paenibacillus woosongensis]